MAAICNQSPSQLQSHDSKAANLVSVKLMNTYIERDVTEKYETI
jgi:hypothetical protein